MNQGRIAGIYANGDQTESKIKTTPGVKNEPNPDYVSAPYVSSGWLEGIMVFCAARPPVNDDEVVDSMTLWIKLPERTPMRFKNGKWVPWLNPPVGWEIFLPKNFDY